MRQELSIYIHIPYCKQKCLYCDFLSFAQSGDICGGQNSNAMDCDAEDSKDRCDSGSGVQDTNTGRRKEVKSYVNSLLAEMQQMAERYHDQYEIISVFIGGGTPSSVDEKYITQILCQLKTLFKVRENAEISIEVNPGTVTREKLQEYREAGVNRLSFGLQSAIDSELARLGRIHTYAEFVDNYKLARKLGFQNINIDLMSAIPEQTEDSFRQTLEAVIALQPEHISAYSLIVEEGTPFAVIGEDNLQLPDEETERKMYHMAVERLAAAGYEHYEISNFARKGYACQHNIVYWRRGEYLGLGLGAASLICGVRYSNTRSRKDYLAGAYQDVDTIEELSVPDQMAETMFLGLRMMQGVGEELFFRTYGRRLREVYPGVVERFEAEGLLTTRDGFIALTERGIDVSNSVMCEFMPE